MGSAVGSKSAFGIYLRELRKRKGIHSPAELARRMRDSVSVSGILKRERGELKINESYIKAFVKAVPVSDEEHKFIRQYLNLFQLQFDLWKSDKSILDINREASARLEESNRIQCFSPTLIPHILQTSGYTRGIFDAYRCEAFSEETEQTVLVRTKSSLKIQSETHRSIQLLNWEPALYNVFGGKVAMLEQLAQLMKLATNSHIEYGIIPFGVAGNIPTDCTFTIYDRLFVTAESAIGNLYTGDKQKVDWAIHNFDQLWAARSLKLGWYDSVKKAINYIQSHYDN